MYRICLTYTLHVHHVHELREYLHCSSKTNLMLDLFSRGKLIIADFREASWQSQNKSFLEFKTTATFKKLKWLRNTLSESFILWIPYEPKQLFSWFGGSDLILKERIDRKPIRLIASMITARPSKERLETSWISHPLCQQANPIKVTLVGYNFKLKSEHHWQWTSHKKCSYTASVIHIWSWALSCRRMFRTSSPSGSWSNWSSITLTEKSTLRIKRFHDFIERVSKFYYTSSSVSLRGISMDVAILKVGLAQWNRQVILHKMSLTVRY